MSFRTAQGSGVPTAQSCHSVSMMLKETHSATMTGSRGAANRSRIRDSSSPAAGSGPMLTDGCRGPVLVYGIARSSTASSGCSPGARNTGTTSDAALLFPGLLAQRPADGLHDVHRRPLRIKEGHRVHRRRVQYQTFVGSGEASAGVPTASRAADTMGDAVNARAT